MSERSRRRYSVNKLRRRTQSELDPEVEPDSRLTELLCERIHSNQATAADLAECATQLDTPAAARLLASLRETQSKLLSSYRQSLRERSTSLSAAGCWEFLAERLEQARNFGIEPELRQMVFDAAGVFANAKMLALTRKYHRLAR